MYCLVVPRWRSYIQIIVKFAAYQTITQGPPIFFIYQAPITAHISFKGFQGGTAGLGLGLEAKIKMTQCPPHLHGFTNLTNSKSVFCTIVQNLRLLQDTLINMKKKKKKKKKKTFTLLWCFITVCAQPENRFRSFSSTCRTSKFN